MRDYICLGLTPYEAECVQVDSRRDYFPKMLDQAKRYQKLLENIFVEAKKYGCYFSIKRFNHDFGVYAEVCISFDTDDPISLNYALFVEKNIPASWYGNDTILMEEQKNETTGGV